MAIYNRVEADNMAHRVENIEAAMQEEFVRLDETVKSALDLDRIATVAARMA